MFLKITKNWQYGQQFRIQDFDKGDVNSVNFPIISHFYQFVFVKSFLTSVSSWSLMLFVPGLPYSITENTRAWRTSQPTNRPRRMPWRALWSRWICDGNCLILIMWHRHLSWSVTERGLT